MWPISSTSRNAGRRRRNSSASQRLRRVVWRAGIRPETGDEDAEGMGHGSFTVSSWPGRSAKRVFALDVPAIHVLLVATLKDVDARYKAGHDGGGVTSASPQSAPRPAPA